MKKSVLNIKPTTAVKVADMIINFFDNINDIQDYFRLRKSERIKDMSVSSLGLSLEDDMFQEYDMSPEDMNIEISQIESKIFYAMLEKTASFNPEPAPGKELKLVVKETNTNTIVGFIKLGSPIINSKPRNDYLDGVPELSIFNKRAIMGFFIVPVQPFGYNYLGGKLLSLICASHRVREMLNEKYNTEFCLFETTSLYGSIKKTSMYDGLKPFLRYMGDTESKFVPTLGDEVYSSCKKIIEDDIQQNLNKMFDTSSRKLKITKNIISSVKSSLKETDESLYEKFVSTIKKAESVTTKKRFYMSDYGFANVKEILLGKTDTLIKGQNYDKHNLENIITWWKKKATSRYNNLKAENKVRKELEVWTKDTINTIEIIR